MAELWSQKGPQGPHVPRRLGDALARRGEEGEEDEDPLMAGPTTWMSTAGRTASAFFVICLGIQSFC